MSTSTFTPGDVVVRTDQRPPVSDVLADLEADGHLSIVDPGDTTADCPTCRSLTATAAREGGLRRARTLAALDDHVTRSHR